MKSRLLKIMSFFKNIFFKIADQEALRVSSLINSYFTIDDKGGEK